MKFRTKLAVLGALLALGLTTLLTYPLPSVAQGNDQISEMLYRNNRGVAFLDQYKFKEATQEFLAILSANPEVTPVKVNLGIAYFYDQKYEEASATLQQVLEVAPDEARANYVLGLIYRNQDEVDNAIAAFSAVNRQDSLDSSTNYYLGRLFMRQREYATAITYFRKVIELEPYNASAHYNLATALSRSGKRAEGQAEMKEFKRLQDLFGSTTVGLQYLEQGKYAIAIDEIPENYLGGYSPPEEAPIKVEFAEVAEASGISFSHGGPGKANIRVKSATDLEGALVPYMGSGIAFVDYDQDGRLDLYFANASAGAAKGALYRNRGDGTFEDKTPGSGLEFSGKTMQAIWGDYDNDGFPDPYLINYGANVLYHNEGDGTFKDVTAETGVGDSSWAMGGAYVDYDHDGDLDILVANFMPAAKGQASQGIFPEDFSGAGNVLYRNNGDATFSNVSEESKMSGEDARSTAVIAADLDSSRDVDFYVVNQSAPNQLLNNMRDGTFASPSGNATDVISSSGLGVAAGDLSRNGFMDLVLPDMEPTRSSVLFNHGNSYFEYAEASSAISSELKVPVLNTQLFDFDNDGDLDVLVLSSRLFQGTGGLGASQNLFLFENRNQSFVNVTDRVRLGQVKGKAVRGISIGDYDSDGDLDFAVSVNGGRPLLFRNEGGNQNNWLTVKPVGTNSNKYGLGVKAEIRAGESWEELETFGGQGYLTHNPPVLHFGLGSRKKVDIVRLLWPNGVLQSLISRLRSRNWIEKEPVARFCTPGTVRPMSFRLISSGEVHTGIC
jgi:tetratricopeptide (TPR) repeat protein